MNEGATFNDAIIETVNQAKVNGKLYYLYLFNIRNKSGGWNISTHYWDDWLFKAYPGGRKMLSAKGEALLEEKWKQYLKRRRNE